MLTSENYNQLSYIKACLKEALRMNPVVAGDARWTGKDIVLEGYQIPKNVSHTALAINFEYIFIRSFYRLKLQWHVRCCRMTLNTFPSQISLYLNDG